MTYRVISKPNSKKTDYTPRGGCKEFVYATEHEVIAWGPRDTGKSLAACWIVHLTAMKYPNSRLLIVRETQKSIYSSVMKTFLNVINGSPGEAYGGEKPEKFMYPNGAEVWMGGMDNAEKILV